MSKDSKYNRKKLQFITLLTAIVRCFRPIHFF